MDRTAPLGGQAKALSTDAGRAAGVYGQNENASAYRAIQRPAVRGGMSPGRHHWLTRMYPPWWRSRYGDEMDDLLSRQLGWRDVLDVAKSALTERLYYSQRPGDETMPTYPGNVAILVRKPSAIAPIAMSLCALAVVVIAIAVSGPKRQADEGAAAHLWQILMAGQLPILAWFAFQWLKRDLKAGLLVLAVQIAAFVAALLPVWLLGL